MENKLLLNKVTQLLQFKLINISVSKKDLVKISKAVNTLRNFSKNQNPLPLYILMYASYYIDILGQNNLQNIYTNVSRFIRDVDMSEKNIGKISNNEIESATQLDKDWNSLNKSTINSFPFSLRATMMKYNIKVGINTFFDHSSNFIYFAKIARWINNNKMKFPQIHGGKEFFIHLPIYNKGRNKDYQIVQYTDESKIYNSLNTYYEQQYTKIKEELRLQRFLDIVQEETIPALMKSDIWGKDYLCQRI